MDGHQLQDTPFRRINQEIVLAARNGGISVEGAGAAIAVTDLCRAYRAVRPDVDQACDWMDRNVVAAAELFRLLVRIADAACKVSGPICRS